MNADYSTDIKFIKGVGEVRAKLFKKLEIETLYDLVHFYPRSYLDFTQCTSVSKLQVGQTACVRAILGCDVSEHIIRKNMVIYKTMAADETGIFYITIFNNKYLAQALKTGEEYFFMGKVILENGHLAMSSPLIEPYSELTAMKPVYSQTASLRSKTIEKVVSNGLLALRESREEDPIPDSVRKKYKLCHESYALNAIHFPKSQQDIEIAKNRLIFEELFLLQCGLLSMRQGKSEKTEMLLEKDFTKNFVASLPFTLTSAQQRTIDECVSDMKKCVPMNRLVQGDVGSGKTVVAAALIHSMVKNGYQCAMMAPTELLARQHCETLSKLLGNEIKTVLLTGAVTASVKNKIKNLLKSGEADVVVGTHALITEDVEFSSLGLVVTDEQHRFGVRQRGSLSEKGKSPHVLVMSATPIPRTLSLIIYGDLDISVIDELPRGRQKISTYAVDSSYKPRIYSFIKKHLDKGLQAYIVCPLVEEGENELTAATKYAEELSENEFSGYNVGLLHGKMKPKDKKQVMEDFVSGKISLLVSTTVIEVGIDVPNAVLMVIENADMFGLSQLHQLRGRVGRGTEKSYCVLISDTKGETAKKRMDIMCKTNDGFLIADEDLRLRDPGDFFGSKQHGLPNLRIADLISDMVTLKNTQQAAKEIFKKDSSLSLSENKGLRKAVKRLFDKTASTILN